MRSIFEVEGSFPNISALGDEGLAKEEEDSASFDEKIFFLGRRATGGRNRELGEDIKQRFNVDFEHLPIGVCH